MWIDTEKATQTTTATHNIQPGVQSAVPLFSDDIPAKHPRLAAEQSSRSAASAEHIAKPKHAHTSNRDQAQPAPEITIPTDRSSRSGQATRGALLLAGGYLFGTLLSGILQALSQASEQDMLRYYLESWGTWFDLSDVQAALRLFCAQYLSLAGAVTLLLVFGLCALGSVLIVLFLMLYGVGMGIISLQLYLQQSLLQYAVSSLFWGLPATAAIVCLCIFGASALQVSTHLQQAAFGVKESNGMPSSARLLLGQYILMLLLLLPICAAATALLYVWMHGIHG
jgi:hypothetical protein